jgi:predicted amidohydrolase YtcJ
METVFKNARIHTMTRTAGPARAMSVQFGRIRSIGSIDAVERNASGAAQVVDLKGLTVAPGFIDTHNHFCLYAMLIDQVDCRPAAGCLRGKDVVAALREKAEKTPPGTWVMGWGYAPYLLEDKKELTRKDLDLAARDHPICLVHVSVHGAVVNSAALGELGFTEKTPDPPGGVIHRDPDGTPNGILSESAFMGPLFFNTPSIYAKIMSAYDEAARAEMMIRCADTYHRFGVVGAHDPFVDAMTLRTYQKVAAENRFPFRLNAYILNSWADPLLAAGIHRGFGSEWVKIGAIKMFLDGGMSSRTAAVFEPYASAGGGTGILNYDQNGIDSEIEKFDRAGYQISVHAQGDRALDMLLKAFEGAIAAGNPHRHHIVHAGNLTDAQIDQVAKMNLYIASQANFFSLLGDGFIDAYGPVRSQKLYRFKTLLDRRINLALSSDCPVADPDPLIGLRDAVLRKTGSGQDIGPSESITPAEALALYTREAAYFSFEENDRGTLEEGKFADFVVLEKDPLTVSPENIPECRVKMTVVGGKIVYNDM